MQTPNGWSHSCSSGILRGVPFRWCVDAPTASLEGLQKLEGPVLYYLHGYGGSAESWSRSADFSITARTWQESGFAGLPIVSLSLGKAWLMTDLPNSEMNNVALLPLVADEIIPEIERHLGWKNPERYLRGDSMGGFNASQLLFKRSALFSKVALVCPIVLPIDPHANQEEVSHYVATSSSVTSRELVDGVLTWLKWEFPDKKAWREHDALLMAQQVTARLPKTYLTCGDDDPYGFHAGTQDLAERLSAKGEDVTWRSLSGGHCVSDVESMARFFLPDPKPDQFPDRR